MSWVETMGAKLALLLVGLSACTPNTTAKSADEPRRSTVELGSKALLVDGMKVTDAAAFRDALASSAAKTRGVDLVVTGPSTLNLVRVLKAITANRIEEVDLEWVGESTRVKLTNGGTRLGVLALGGPQQAAGAWYLDSAPSRWDPGAALDEGVFRSLAPRCQTPCQLFVWVRSPTTVEQLFTALQNLAAWRERLPNLGLFFFDAERKERLPPELIQVLVSMRFPRFEVCYQRGLSEYPQLAGMVVVRFVIEPDGHVSTIEEGESDLPTPVRECILEGFEGLRFPNPEGGVVKVSYPLQFAPGGRSAKGEWAR
jgi:hypothetical protein